MIQTELKQELKKRWTKAQEALKNSGSEGCLITTNVNLLYLSGRVFSGYIYFTPQSDPLFFVKRPVGLDGEGVVYVRKPEDIPLLLQERGLATCKELALELDQITYNDTNRLAAAFGQPTIGNATSVMRLARLTKTEYELNELRKAGEIHCAAYKRIPSLFKAGMTDIELSIEIERLFRQMGSLGAIRIFGQSMELHMGSLLTGSNAETPSPYDFAMGGGGLSASLPVSCNGTQIEKGMTVMVDIGGAFTNNMTDMTRVFSYGKSSDLAYKAHQVCLEIESDIQAIARPGTPCADLYNMALAKVEQNRLGKYFMGTMQQAGFIGHGIGLELNEIPVLAPRSKEILMEGMTFALEPKMVIPKVGAVGIENSYIVTSAGIENVTPLDGAIVEL